jgi:NAD(P)H-dependent FMN reductase
MTRIAVIAGTTRPHRKSADVAAWVLERAASRSDATFDLVDLSEVGLPLYDEPIPPKAGRYQHEHTRAWARTVASYDGFVVVTAEYNHSIPAVLKNALDFVYAEWNDKAIGFVGYGSGGGIRAVEHLRQVAGELKLLDVRPAVALDLATDFEKWTTFAPREFQTGALDAVLDDVVRWSRDLADLRSRAEADDAA